MRQTVEPASRNQIATGKNPYQGNALKVLFLCSAGCLRSPTAAHLFSKDPYNWNTRCAGTTMSYAITPVSHNLLEWADVVYLMDQENMYELCLHLQAEKFDYWRDDILKKCHVLHIEDNFAYRDKELESLLLTAVEKHLEENRKGS